MRSTVKLANIGYFIAQTLRADKIFNFNIEGLKINTNISYLYRQKITSAIIIIHMTNWFQPEQDNQ